MNFQQSQQNPKQPFIVAKGKPNADVKDSVVKTPELKWNRFTCEQRGPEQKDLGPSGMLTARRCQTPK